MARDAVHLEWDLREIFTFLDVGDKVVAQAGARSLNRAIGRVRTQVIRGVASQSAIKPQKLIRRRTKLDRARPDRLAAQVRILLRDIPVSKLSGLRDTGRGGWKSRTGAGVRAFGGRSYPKAFVATGIGGNKQVFERVGNTRRPLKVHKIVVRSEIEAHLEAEIGNGAEYVARELPREITYRMNRGR